MASFKEAIRIPLILLAMMWIVFLVDWIFAMNLNQWGLVPRNVQHLSGILFMPFLHGDFQHLFSNSIPFFLLGTSICYFYKRQWQLVYAFVYIAGGLLVWLAGRSASVHIGASGIIYGFFGFLFFAGLFRKEIKALIIAVIVAVLYGGLIWGIFPTQKAISWEGHLFGALAGVIIAYLLRKKPVEKTS